MTYCFVKRKKPLFIFGRVTKYYSCLCRGECPNQMILDKIVSKLSKPHNSLVLWEEKPI